MFLKTFGLVTSPGAGRVWELTEEQTEKRVSESIPMFNYVSGCALNEKRKRNKIKVSLHGSKWEGVVGISRGASVSLGSGVTWLWGLGCSYVSVFMFTFNLCRSTPVSVSLFSYFRV